MYSKHPGSLDDPVVGGSHSINLASILNPVLYISTINLITDHTYAESNESLLCEIIVRFALFPLLCHFVTMVTACPTMSCNTTSTLTTSEQWPQQLERLQILCKATASTRLGEAPVLMLEMLRQNVKCRRL